jgi:hypothetical protein
MAKQPEHGLRLTPGTFQLKGVVLGTKSNNFYAEKDVSGSKMRSATFGVKYDVARNDDGTIVDPNIGKSIYPTVQGFTRAKVYFSRKTSDGKPDTKDVLWENRFTFAEENPSYKLIGCNIGLEKDADDKNIKVYATEFDAAKLLKDKLKDDMSVFIRGNIDFRSYINKQGEVRRLHNFNATQISLCSDVAFDAEDFKAVNDFEQEIVYTEIAKEEENGKATGRFVLSGYVVLFNAIEPVSFILTDRKLADLIRKNLKAYNSIKVHGRIEVSHIVEEVTSTETDEWGEANSMSNRRTNASTKRELVVTGATPSTIDRESFTEIKVQEGIQKLKKKEKNNKNFGEKKETVSASNDDEWGSASTLNTEDDEPW